MGTINVILQAKARDKGVHKWLSGATKLADGFADSLGRAKKEMGGIGSGSLGTLAAAGASPRGGGGGARTRGGGSRDGVPSFDKALKDAQRARSRASQQEARNAQRQVSALARAGQQRVRGAQRAAKNLNTLSDAQLREVETQREITSRRRRAARSAAQTSLGADPTKPGKAKMGPYGKLEFAENLAVAGAEFEQFGSRVEQGIRGSFDAFKDYEKAVVEVSTLTDSISIDQIEEITKGAAEEFGGLPTEQVKAFYAIVSAGASDAADAQAQLAAANKLAIGGVATQEEAVLAISKSVANFGVSSEKASDIMFAAVQRGQTTVSEMAGALPQVANSAARAGLSMEETAAAISFLSLKMKSSATASTGLNQALVNISKPSKMAREEAKKLGIDFSAAGIKAAGGLEEWVLQIAASEKYSAQTLGRLFESSEAQAAIGGLVQDLGGFHSVLGDATNSAGKAETAYAKMSDTAAQKAKVLEAQWELLKIQAGNELVPALLDLSETTMPIITGFRDWIKENPNLAATLAKVAIGTVVASKAAGGLISAYSMWQTLSAASQLGNMKLAGATTTLTTAVTKQGTAMSLTSKIGGGMQSMVGAMPAIFAGAGLAIVAFNMVLDQAESSLTKYGETIKSVEEKQKNITFSREATSAEKTKFEADKATKIAALEEQREGARGKKAKAEIDAQIAAVSSSTLGPVQKTEAELLMERRNRLISVTNAARTAATESRVGGVDDDANLLQKSLGGWSGLLNVASGVTEDLDMQAKQAELDLAAFDKQYGSTLGLGDAAFTTPGTETTGVFGDAGTFAALQELVAATQMVAANTTKTTGPSMEAGLSS
jgi:TP901 family phage tail tape measure protein